MPKVEELAETVEKGGVKTLSFDQIAEHLKSGDPNKTVFLQGTDGKTRLFVNNDAQSLPNFHTDGKSFDDLGTDICNDIEFELQFRLHKDSVMTVAREGETLSPAVPAIMYHNHVWWFWSYELSFKNDNEELKTIFTLKSIGPSMNPNRELPRGALGENVPRTQMAPNVKNARLKINDKLYNLKTILGTPDNSYILDELCSLEELKTFFKNDDPFLTFNVLIQAEKKYFDLESLSGLNEKEITKTESKNVETIINKILSGEKPPGYDYVLTFGNSLKNESVEYFVHKQALASCPLLADIIRNKFNPPGDQILVPSSEDRIIFPHLKQEDAKFFLNLFYRQKITLPHFGAYARIGRVYCMLVEKQQILHLFKHWQKLLIQNLLETKKTKDMNRIIVECVKTLIGIYSAPYGALPVAKRVAVSLFADQISIAESQDKDLIAELKNEKQFATYNCDKFLPGVVKMKLFIGAVKKQAII